MSRLEKTKFDTVAYFTLRRLTPHLPPVSYSLTFSVFPPKFNLFRFFKIIASKNWRKKYQKPNSQTVLVLYVTLIYN